MKSILKCFTKFSAHFAPLALVVATVTANSTCFFFSYQPEVPAKLACK